ncbi:hypothetical protein K474DRAFT_1767595 [Panus rudis PR-1116 ss-1]|nr:hypothetical protein K474DRAFT_1767595 [Panus rudis PR-1116 ss-1]
MSQTNGTAKDLNESKIQALQALINSVSPEGTQGSNGGDSNLTPDQIRKLSEKLGELLGDDGLPSDIADGTKRNEKGELVNEEGLPIIDINEPLAFNESTTTLPPPSTGNFDDPDLLPLWALSPAEKARRKAERERILDLLEEEERVQQAREQAAIRERLKVEMEKRKEAGKAELERLKKARDLQKKMGRALVRSVVHAPEDDKKEATTSQELKDQSTDGTSKTKKSVTFADDADDASKEAKDSSSGDTSTPKSSGKTPLQIKSDKMPMKMEVVERMPAGKQPPPRAVPETLPKTEHKDKPVIDDENSPSKREDKTVGKEKYPWVDADSSDDEADDRDGDEDVRWEEDDLDFAQHQREIALAYYEKRATIGSQASSAMRAHTHDENEWDQPDVPLDASLASEPPKPPVSKFKQSLLTRSATTTLASHSLGQAVLPVSQSSALKSAVRMGKLEDGKLVGGEEGESDGEVDDDMKEILELLRKGEITNVGPQPHTSSPSSVPAQDVSNAPAPKPEPQQPVSAARSKVSKFKLSMTAEPRSSGTTAVSSPAGSSLNTPTTITERSSPKPMSPEDALPQGRPIAVPTRVSQRPSKPPQPPQIPGNAGFVSPQGAMPSMVVESPSFERPGAHRVLSQSTQLPDSATPNVFSNVVESPSFLPPGMKDFMSSPGFHSVIIDPSAPSVPSVAPPVPVNALSESSQRPPVVMSAEVREARPARSHGPTGKREDKNPPRVSRFKAERM